MEVTHVGDESRLGLFCKLYFSLVWVMLKREKLGEQLKKIAIEIIIIIKVMNKIIMIIKLRLAVFQMVETLFVSYYFFC